MFVLEVALAGASGCGLGDAQVSETTTEIIGGESSPAGAYSATGALLKGWAYRCTATLIRPDVILTAAHCLEDTGYGDFAFTLDRDVSDGADDPVPVIITHQHPDYKARGKPLDVGQVNDVGVAVLARPITDVPLEILHTTSIGPDIAIGDELQISGYGVNVWFARATAGLKREARVYVDGVSLWELRTVAADPQPCTGDSGAPLMRETPAGRRLIGIVIRGAGESYRCDNGAIASRIVPYVDWIEEAARDRDLGCAVGGRRGTGSLWPLAAVLSTRLLRRRRRLTRGCS